MTQTVIYFTAGRQATSGEIAEINKLSALAQPSLIVLVRAATIPNIYDSLEEADLLAGTIPNAYKEDGEPIYPVVNVDAPPVIVGTKQAVVSSEIDLAGVPVVVNGAAAADYDVAFTVVSGAVTAITITTSA